MRILRPNPFPWGRLFYVESINVDMEDRHITFNVSEVPYDSDSLARKVIPCMLMMMDNSSCPLASQNQVVLLRREPPKFNPPGGKRLSDLFETKKPYVVPCDVRITLSVIIDELHRRGYTEYPFEQGEVSKICTGKYIRSWLNFAPITVADT